MNNIYYFYKISLRKDILLNLDVSVVLMFPAGVGGFTSTFYFYHFSLNIPMWTGRQWVSLRIDGMSGKQHIEQ
ncbi:MAG: hypothetical protein LBE13_17710 [Bacteroidales bacterium]|nr:hypothetical protein [Bacteroidales bacterium]